MDLLLLLHTGACTSKAPATEWERVRVSTWGAGGVHAPGGEIEWDIPGACGPTS